MTADHLLEELIRVRWDFRAYWEGENLYRDYDGSFSVCGAFSQFTGFFREHHQTMTKEELEALAALVGRCEREPRVAEAAYTCFLENIAGDPPDATLSPYLSPEAIKFMSHWKPKEKA